MRIVKVHIVICTGLISININSFSSGFTAGEASVYIENQSGRGNVVQNVSRAELWSGETVLGERVKELNVVSVFFNGYFVVFPSTVQRSQTKQT